MKSMVALALTLLVGWCALPAAADTFSDGQAALRRGDYVEAIRLYTRDIESGKNSPRDLAVLHNQRGLAYRRNGQPDLAIADFNRAMEITPNDADLFNNRGIAYKAKGDYKQARADYTRSIELNEQQANAYYNRSIIQERLGNIDAAVKDIKRFLELSPDDAEGKARLLRLEKIK